MNGLDAEISAMQAIASALDVFTEEDTEVVDRILKWAIDRYAVSFCTSSDQEKKEELRLKNGPESQQVDFPNFYHSKSPHTDAERALLAGYYIQIISGAKDFSGFEANKLLKELGFGIGNITDAFTALIRRRPGLVMQAGKSGANKQARKKYRVTQEGIREVESRSVQPSE